MNFMFVLLLTCENVVFAGTIYANQDESAASEPNKTENSEETTDIAVETEEIPF